MNDQYFQLTDGGVIENLDDLLSLNIRKKYYNIGDTAPIKEEPGIVNLYAWGHETSGIFRGQKDHHPLVPTVYRDVDVTKLAGVSAQGIEWKQHMALSLARQFSVRAKAQNPDFPNNEIDQLCIAQHFGIPTPLLDWSRSVMPAVYFAIREYLDGEEPNDPDLAVHLYHVEDDRQLTAGIPQDSSLENYTHSALIEPFHIDRRIERQQGVFTFHPFPSRVSGLVPIVHYRLPVNMALKLIDLFTGLGLTQDFYFPDYAGISRAVLNRSQL